MPVGFKNATDGSLQIAIDAMGAAMRPHSFLGIDQDGITRVLCRRREIQPAMWFFARRSDAN